MSRHSVSFDSFAFHGEVESAVMLALVGPPAAAIAAASASAPASPGLTSACSPCCRRDCRRCISCMRNAWARGGFLRRGPLLGLIREVSIGEDIGSGQRRPRGAHHIKERRRNPAAEQAEPSTAHRRNAPEVPTSSPPAVWCPVTCLCHEGLHILERHRASHPSHDLPFYYIR